MGMDLRGIPTSVCPVCGSSWLLVPVKFDQETYEVVAWGTEGKCLNCETLLTACTPVDAEKINDRRTE